MHGHMNLNFFAVRPGLCLFHLRLSLDLHIRIFDLDKWMY
jgi:hypothetical protein